MSSKIATLPAPPATDKTVRTAAFPTEEQIAMRAHQLFLERGGAPGFELEDWLQAERELKAAAANPSGSPKPSGSSAAPRVNPRSPR